MSIYLEALPPLLDFGFYSSFSRAFVVEADFSYYFQLFYGIRPYGILIIN